MPKTHVHRRAGVLAAALAAASLAGCGAAAEAGDDRPVVLTTFTVLADMAQTVAGDHLRVESIMKPGAEVHGYEPTPLDIAKASEADLVLDNGLGLEAWFAQFIDAADAPNVVVSAAVDPIGIAGADAEEAPNPHAWMSPADAQLYVDAIARAFSELAPEHADDFARAADAYAAEIDAVRDELVAAVETIPDESRTLVTCEGAFSYLARDVGLDERYLWLVNSEQQATPRQIAGVIEYVDATSVPVVFCESTVSDAAMQQVVDATGAAFGGVLYVDSLSDEGGPVPTYLELLRHDARLIADGLTGGAS